MARGWGFKIDHDKAIAEDERQIALYESAAVRAFSQTLTDKERGWLAEGIWLDAFSLLLDNEALRPVRLAEMGLTERDFALAAYAYDTHHLMTPGWEAKITALIDAHSLKRYDPETYRAGHAAMARMDRDALPVMTEEKRIAMVKHHKTALSRHKRNKQKHG